MIKISEYKHFLAHFYTEEQLIFPILGNTHEGVGKALFEHRRIKRLFVKEKNIIKSLSLIEEDLEKHIRFEERLLFAEIERPPRYPEFATQDSAFPNAFAICGPDRNRTCILSSGDLRSIHSTTGPC